MHRNTLLFISLLAVIAALLFGFNIGRKWYTPIPSPSPTPRATPKISQFLQYTNILCGVSFEYPSSLTKLEATAGAMFVDPQNASNSVAFACQKDILRPALTPEVVTLESTGSASITAQLYRDSVDTLIFTHPKNDLDIFIAGLGSAFTKILSTLKVL